MKKYVSKQYTFLWHQVFLRSYQGEKSSEIQISKMQLIIERDARSRFPAFERKIRFLYEVEILFFTISTNLYQKVKNMGKILIQYRKITFLLRIILSDYRSIIVIFFFHFSQALQYSHFFSEDVEVSATAIVPCAPKCSDSKDIFYSSSLVSDG